MTPGTQLPIARYRFRFRMASELRLPEYAGSLLRGQFGAALRRSACMTGAKECNACPLWRTCPYPAIFEAPPPRQGHALQAFSQVPNPYIIEAPPFHTLGVAAGEILEFHMVLIGHALTQLALIVHAWQRAFAHGIGKQRTPGQLESIDLLPADGAPQTVWDPDNARLLPHTATLPLPTLPACEHITLHFHTPLRLQSQGRALPIAELTPRTLIAQLIRRISLLLEFHASIPLSGQEAQTVRNSEPLTQQKNLRWQEWTRYSSRQQQSMQLSGACGDWTLSGPLSPLLPWLWLGQWLHAGKSASFGLGAYTLEMPAAPHKSGVLEDFVEASSQTTEKSEKMEVSQ